MKALTRRSVFHRVPSPNEPRDPLEHFYNVVWYERRSIEALLFAVDRLARQPGRKALLFVTDGGPLYGKLPSAPESVFCRAAPRWGRGWEEQRRQLEPRDDRDPLQEVTRRAARNGIALLPVNSDPYLAGGWGLAVRAGLNQTMVRLADMTGGDAVLLGGYLAKRLPVFLRRRADAHVLTFRDPFAGDGDYLRIELHATRPGIRLSYRAGYQAVEER